MYIIRGFPRAPMFSGWFQQSLSLPEWLAGDNRACQPPYWDAHDTVSPIYLYSISPIDLPGNELFEGFPVVCLWVPSCLCEYDVSLRRVSIIISFWVQNYTLVIVMPLKRYNVRKIDTRGIPLDIFWHGSETEARENSADLPAVLPV